jgi:hypothetical protein
VHLQTDVAAVNEQRFARVDADPDPRQPPANAAWTSLAALCASDARSKAMNNASPSVPNTTPR